MSRTFLDELTVVGKKLKTEINGLSNALDGKADAATIETTVKSSVSDYMNDNPVSTTYPKLAEEGNYTVYVQYPYGDVRRYGAVGDGVTDDTMAFKNAVSVCSAIGSVVKVPKGIFMLRHLEVKNNTVIEGIGEQSILKTTGDNYLSEGYFGDLINGREKTNIVIKNIVLDGNINKFPIGDIFNVNHGIGLFNMRSCSNVLVDHVIFQNNAYCAIKADGFSGEIHPENWEVVGCTFKNVDSCFNCQHQGIKNFKFHDNYIDGHDYSEPIVLEVKDASCYIEDVDIYDNIMKNKPGAYAIFVGTDGNITEYSTKNVKIHDNIMLNMNSGIRLSYASVVEIYNNKFAGMYNFIDVLDSTKCSIHDNYFDGRNSDYDVNANYCIRGKLSKTKIYNNVFDNLQSNEAFQNDDKTAWIPAGMIQLIGNENIFKNNLFCTTNSDGVGTRYSIQVCGSDNYVETSDVVKNTDDTDTKKMYINLGMDDGTDIYSTSYQDSSVCKNNIIIHRGKYVLLSNKMSDSSTNGIGTNKFKQVNDVD